MAFRRFLTLCVALTLSVGLAAPPAAAEASGGTFECTGTLLPWPGAGVTTCTGTATGVYREGPTTVVCTPLCTFTMTMNYATICVAGEPPLVANFFGNIQITNGPLFATPYNAVFVAHDVAITTSSPVGAGDAALIPTAFPLPSCAAPWLLQFEMAGSLAFD
jgi:hypothetical protein